MKIESDPNYSSKIAMTIGVVAILLFSVLFIMQLGKSEYNVAEQLKSRHPSAQLAAFETLKQEIKVQQPGKYLNNSPDLIPFLISTLKDKNAEIATLSVEVLYELALIVLNEAQDINKNSDTSKPKYVFPNPTKDKTLKPVLMEALSASSVPEVRGLAARLLASAYHQQSELEALLRQRLTAELKKREPSLAASKGVMQALWVLNKTKIPQSQFTDLKTSDDHLTETHQGIEFEPPQTIQDVVRALNASDPAVKIQAAHMIAKLKPGYALSPLIYSLIKTKDNRVFEQLLIAVEAYGTKAEPYLPQLRRLLSLNRDPRRQQLIHVTIKRIRGLNT